MTSKCELMIPPGLYLSAIFCPTLVIGLVFSKGQWLIITLTEGIACIWEIFATELLLGYSRCMKLK